jgi:hypothetical protein
VCGQALTRQWMQHPDGRKWCMAHRSMPSCAWCSLPTADAYDGVPRCMGCSSTAIDSGRQLDVPLRHVGAAMERRGLVVKSPVKLVLRPAAQLAQRGLLAGLSPDTLGVTHYQGSAGNGSITIAILTGLPDVMFRAVLVHEFAHAYLASIRTGSELPPLVEEGFAEALAVDYLSVDMRTPAGRAHVEDMKRNADPVYGDGLRRVYPALLRLGPERLGRALAAGRLHEAGLA